MISFTFVFLVVNLICFVLLVTYDYCRFVSRAGAKDIHNHVILGISDFKPKEFAAQINLNMKNLWGILLKFVDIIKKKPDGKYILLRDTEKNAVLLYAIEQRESENPKEEEKAAETSASTQQ